MKKVFIIFLVACLLMSLLPSVGMIFFPTTRTSENKPMVAAPAIVNAGKLNQKIFQEFETYFNQHMALRNPMLFVDATIQSKVFGTSNVDGVICGTDGWLFYSSTLRDYLGERRLTERQLYNLAHNFSLVSEYLAEQEIDFVLTIAPNKNSLYGEYMPYYNKQKIATQYNAELLERYFTQQSVPYADLFQAFEEQSEVLYLKGDSHWNNKGACMVYNQVMKALEIPHENYGNRHITTFQNGDGDLNRMLYSFYGPKETDYTYDFYGNYKYKTGKSVEDGLIITENSRGRGSMLMFRDSFANTLIPFFSEHFATACYSKGEPNTLEQFVETYKPDCVVIEKVERNMDAYLNTPPIVSALATQQPEKISVKKTNAKVSVATAEADAQYLEFRGTVEAENLQRASRILVSVGDSVYQAYHTGENGFLMYLDRDLFKDTSVKVKVYVLDDASCVQVTEQTLTLPVE